MTKKKITVDEMNAIICIFQAIVQFNSGKPKAKDLATIYLTKESQYICTQQGYKVAERLRNSWVLKHIQNQCLTRKEALELNDFYQTFRKTWGMSIKPEYVPKDPNAPKKGALPNAIIGTKRVIDF